MLIFYNRSDIEGPKLSDYSMQTFKSHEEAEGLKVTIINPIIKKIVLQS